MAHRCGHKGNAQELRDGYQFDVEMITSETRFSQEIAREGGLRPIPVVIKASKSKQGDWEKRIADGRVTS